jgi:hypothetical protein
MEIGATQSTIVVRSNSHNISDIIYSDAIEDLLKKVLSKDNIEVVHDKLKSKGLNSVGRLRCLARTPKELFDVLIDRFGIEIMPASNIALAVFQSTLVECVS